MNAKQARNLEAGDRIRHSFGGPERTYVVASATLRTVATAGHDYAVEAVSVLMDEEGETAGQYGPGAMTHYAPDAEVPTA